MSDMVIGYPVSDSLEARTRDVIDRLRESPERMPRSEVVDLVGDISSASFDYHFIRPLEDLGVGFATHKSINAAISGTVRVIRSSMQQVVKNMPNEHYAKLAGYIEDAYYSGRR